MVEAAKRLYKVWQGYDEENKKYVETDVPDCFKGKK